MASFSIKVFTNLEKYVIIYIREELIMSTSDQFVWSFEEGILNKFEELQDDGRLDDIVAKILNSTNLSTVFVDEVSGVAEVRGIMSDYNYDENKFNDDVLIAMRIIKDSYTLIKEENEEDTSI